MYAPYQPQKKNSGIYGYMNSAKLIQKVSDDAIPNAEQNDHTQHMTTADYAHFIHQYVPRYHREEARTPRDVGKIAEYKQKLLQLLDEYNAAAQRENKQRYDTVKEFMVDHPLPPAAR